MLHREDVCDISFHQKLRHSKRGLRPASSSMSMSRTDFPCLLICCFWCTEKAACYAECVNGFKNGMAQVIKIIEAARVGAGLNTAHDMCSKVQAMTKSSFSSNF